MTVSRAVLIVDDHRMFADGLDLLLGSQDDIEVVGVEGDAESAIAHCRIDCPDIVVMSVDLPGMDGIAATRELVRLCPAVQVVVVTALTDPDLVAAAVEAGAAGFVSKRQTAHELLLALRTIADAERLFLPDELRALAEKPTKHGARPQCPLTTRELEVLQGLVDGLTTSELARKLFVSPRTVQWHVQSILSKLGARSKLEAVLHGLRHGLVVLRPAENPDQALPGGHDPSATRPPVPATSPADAGIDGREI